MKIIGPSGELEIAIPTRIQFFVFEDGTASMIQDGVRTDLHFARDGLNVWVALEGCTAMFSLPSEHRTAGKTEMRAPMTGRVVSIPVKEGETVKPGDTVAVLEAMKMEYRLEAEIEGKVAQIGAAVGDLVDLGQLLVKLE